MAAPAPHVASVTSPPPAEGGGGPVVLSEVAQGLGSLQQRAMIWSTNADTISRAFMVLVTAGIFIWLNWAVMHLIARAFDQDMMMMQKFPQTFKPSDRVVSANVFMSLIGATVVQVGVAIIAIVSYLFPKSRAETSAPNS